MSDTYQSQAARDAQCANYGGPAYCAYLDRHALELRDYYMRHGDELLAAAMLTRSLSEALAGNNGE
jgi:hypothetical protein